jgi:hypothetical protein
MKFASRIQHCLPHTQWISRLIFLTGLILGTSQVSLAQWNLPWELLNGQILSGSSPNVMASGGLFGPYSIFVRGDQGHLLQYQSSNGAYWSPPKDLGGTLRSDPSCVQVGNQMDCFALGPTGQYKILRGFYRGTTKEFAFKTEELQVWHLHYDGASWGTWQAIPGIVTTRPSVVVSYHGVITILSTDPDTGVLVENNFNIAKQAFNGWVRTVGPRILGQPSCAVFASAVPAPQTELIGCFARQADDDQTLIFNTFNGTLLADNTYLGNWSGWAPVPNAPKIVGDPWATSYPYSFTYSGLQVFVDADIDVFFGSSPAGTMWHGWLSGASWHFEAVGGIFNSGSCSRTSLPRIDCVASGGTSLWHTTWLEPAPTIKTFAASQVSFGPGGGTTTLSWSVEHCDQRFCGLSLGQSVPGQSYFGPLSTMVALGPSGSVPVKVTQTTTYEITASNVYHSNTSYAKVTVTPTAPPTIQSFQAAPNDGYNCLGTADTISWSVGNCSPSNCDITLNGKGYGYAQNVRVAVPHLNPTGHYSLNPGDQVDFTLNASSSGGSASKSLSLTIAPPQVCGGTKPMQLMPFYFAVTGPNGFCSTIAVAADTPPHAASDATAFYGSGYSATPISADDFNNGRGCQ